MSQGYLNNKVNKNVIRPKPFKNTGDLSGLFTQMGLYEAGLWGTDFQVTKQLK